MVLVWTAAYIAIAFVLPTPLDVIWLVLAGAAGVWYLIRLARSDGDGTRR